MKLFLVVFIIAFQHVPHTNALYIRNNSGLIATGLPNQQGDIIPENSTATDDVFAVPYQVTQDGGQNIDDGGQDGGPVCRLVSADQYMSNRIRDQLNMDVKLIEFNLVFPNYSTNPLSVGTSWTYLGTKWARAYSQHGQTLLSLAFNYGMMSLMTLTLGVVQIEAPLMDEPHGCVWNLTEDEKARAVIHLLMRDFRAEEKEVTLTDQERICHEVIELYGPRAGEFVDRCCYTDPIKERLTCTTNIMNIWLNILLFTLVVVKFSLLAFGPLLFISIIESIARDEFPYKVNLRDPLVRTIFLCDSDTYVNRTYKFVLDLRGRKNLLEFNKSVRDMPMGEPLKVKFKRFDIAVNHSTLLTENYVPVGLMRKVYAALFACQLRYMGPFLQCCRSNIYTSFNHVDKEVTWISIFKVIAEVMVVLLAPFPYYLRLFLYYSFEEKEIHARQTHLNRFGLVPQYEGSLLAYLSPTHPFFIAIYVTYFFSAFVLHACLSEKHKEKVVCIIIETFRDLKYLTFVDTLALLVGNLIWPFKRYGVLGALIAPVYWVVVMPITLVVCLYYSVPSIYVIGNMLLRVRYNYNRRLPSGKYKVLKFKDISMYKFSIEYLCGYLYERDFTLQASKPITKSQVKKCIRCVSLLHRFLVISLCILTMIAILFIMAEVIGFLIEICVFTMMGVIVNAGAMLRYTTLLILVVVYSYDTYNNVGQKYLKLNKALFNEVKGRCKNIDVVTSMPSHLQENHGFKSQELSEQADYEESDDVATGVRMHWMINDLVLFMDNEDMPRIPEQLFDEVCEIRVAGAPGPVYQSMIQATKDFLKIVVFIFFVFVVVLTFGEVYQISSTNQMLATLAGGFLPFIMKTLMSPVTPNIELGTVSFKSKLDEIIKGFRQNWPIYDIPVELWTEEDERPPEVAEQGDEKQVVHETYNVVPVHETYNHSGKTAEDNFMLNHGMPSGGGTSLAPISEHPILRTGSRINVTEPQPVDQEPATSNESEDYNVDILIYMPDASNGNNELWLEEWSDLDSYDYEGELEENLKN